MLFGKQLWRVIIQLGIILFLTIVTFQVFYSSSRISVIQHSSKLATSEPIMNLYRSCSNSAFFKEKNSTQFINLYRKCVDATMPSFQFDKFFMGRLDEYKIFLPMKKTFDQTKCIWLTIGIGGTDNAEKEFKEKYPECDLYGIEPSSDQFANFSKYGTIVPYGVGVTEGRFELTVRKGKQYFKKDVDVLSLAEILDKYVGSRLVYYMTIDIEGFEYTILKELLHGKILAEQGIVFCQIDAELHGSLHGPNKEAANILHSFDISASDYVPVYAKPFLIHEKVTWVNIKNEICRKAFDIETLL